MTTEPDAAVEAARSDLLGFIARSDYTAPFGEPQRLVVTFEAAVRADALRSVGQVVRRSVRPPLELPNPDDADFLYWKQRAEAAETALQDALTAAQQADEAHGVTLVRIAQYEALVGAACGFEGVLMGLESGMGVFSKDEEAAIYDRARDTFRTAAAPFLFDDAALRSEVQP